MCFSWFFEHSEIWEAICSRTEPVGSDKGTFRYIYCWKLSGGPEITSYIVNYKMSRWNVWDFLDSDFSNIIHITSFTYHNILLHLVLLWICCLRQPYGRTRLTDGRMDGRTSSHYNIDIFFVWKEVEKEKEPEDIIVKLQQEIKQVQLVWLCPNVPHLHTLKLSLVPPPIKVDANCQIHSKLHKKGVRGNKLAKYVICDTCFCNCNFLS